MKQTYTIGELAEIAGVSTKTLRVYERKGLLLPERNKGNSYRIYTEDAVRELEKIQLMKYLGFSLEQIGDFLRKYEDVGREEMLLSQKRMLERKRAQLDSVIACVERGIAECKEKEMDKDSFLRSLGSIVKNRKADELVWRMGQHSDEPRGWSEFVFEQAGLRDGMRVLDAGAGYGNLWRYNLLRLPKQLQVTCVDRHNTHADSLFEYIKEKEKSGEISEGQFSFVWEDLELMKPLESFNCIFFNHVASFIQKRVDLYEKFQRQLIPGGVLICTWGGYLLYENIKKLLDGFFKDTSPVEQRCHKMETNLKKLEAELRTVFPNAERREYITTLHFDTAEEFTDYLLQVCKSAEPMIEEQRPEFLRYLEETQCTQGQYEITRDTYLFCCRREA